MLNNDLCSAVGLSWSRCRGRAGNAAERDHRGLGGGSTPIIQSLLDIDFYKFSVGHWVSKCYPTVPVRYVFKNRTARVRLADYIDEAELHHELDHVRTLRVNASELHYLRGANEYGERIFSEAYLQFLKELRLPPYELVRVDDPYRLEFSGAWAEAIYWETLALSIVNKLYYRALLACLSAFERDVVMATGTLRLVDKITVLRTRPDIPFSDFGTRRRFSRSWQEYVIRMLAQEIPRQLLGTSNTAMAMQYGLLPIGTLAHEMYIHGRAVIQLGPRGVHLRRYGRVNRNFASQRRRAADEYGIARTAHAFPRRLHARTSGSRSASALVRLAHDGAATSHGS